MDLPTNLDLHRIVFVQVALSTLASTSVSPSYNLPIHLYGLYNIDRDIDDPTPVSSEGLRQYCILLVVTSVLDLFWMYNWSSSTSALPFTMILIGLIIKPITLLTCLNQMKRNGHGGIGSFTSYTFGTSNRQTNFHDLNSRSTIPSSTTGLNHHRETPVWATPQSSQQFRRSENAAAVPPGPSAVSHQASAAALEFGLNLDGHAESDAQHLSDQEVLQAKKELDIRIAQKKQQIQQAQLLNQQPQQQQQPPQAFEPKINPNQSVDGSGYHTLE